MNFRLGSSTVMLVGAVVLALVPTIACADDDFESAPAPPTASPAPAAPGPRSTGRPRTQNTAPRATELPEPSVVAPYAPPPSAVTPGQRYLTEGEIRSMIFGHTISGYVRNSIRYNTYLDPSGKISRLIYNYDRAQYSRNTGQASLRNGLYCIRDEGCYKLVLSGNTIRYADENGKLTGSYFTVIATGNAIGDTLK